jgi:hypothetical protein
MTRVCAVDHLVARDTLGLRPIRRFRRLPAAISLAVVIAICGLQLGASVAQADQQQNLEQCYNSSTKWYARAVSGYPATGTQAIFNTPANWYVYGSNSNTDEAVWLVNDNDLSDSLEAGYVIGYWPYGGGYYSYPIAYVTVNDGASGVHGAQIPQVSGYMSVVSGGSANILGQVFSFNYSVSNGLNLSQGEVNAGSGYTAMGDTSGNSMGGQWSPNYGSSWYAWGWHNDCHDSPYWINSINASWWENGGN